MKSKVQIEGNTISGTAEDITDALNKVTEKLKASYEQKPYQIMSASIKEQKCNYGYEIKTGPTAGDKIPTRKGEAIIHDDMDNAFYELKVFLAIADDAFKHVFTELPELDELKTHEITQEFTVTGFKVQGNEEDEGYSLVGEKYVSLGILGVDTPKINHSSNYKFFEELKDAVSNARNEVELYMNGKSAPKDDEDPNQLKLPFEVSSNEFDEEE